MLHKYVAQRAAQLLKSENVVDALQLYLQYGAPNISQNYNLYYHLSERVLNSNDTHAEYAYLAKLRNILLSLVKSFDASVSSAVSTERHLYLLALSPLLIHQHTLATSYMTIITCYMTFVASLHV